MTVTSPAPALTPELRQHIERWFARRGVPQLIEGYSSASAMDRRAAPLISLADLRHDQGLGNFDRPRRSSRRAMATSFRRLL